MRRGRVTAYIRNRKIIPAHYDVLIKRDPDYVLSNIKNRSVRLVSASFLRYLNIFSLKRDLLQADINEFNI